MSLTTFRHFCAAARVLDVYREDSCASPGSEDFCDRIRDAVTLGLRTENVTQPDHQHRNRTENYLNEQKASLADMLLRAVGVEDNGTNVHGLEVRHNSLYVRSTHMEDWQREVAAYQSPVPLLAAAWVRHSHTQRHPANESARALAATLRYASLPGVHDRRLHRQIQNDDGTAGSLCDVHMHINGATEFTPVWLHALRHPQATHAALSDAIKPSPAKKRIDFFYRQLRTNVATVYHRLCTAARLRYWLCRFLAGKSESVTGHPFNPTSLQALLRGNRHQWGDEDFSLRHHPFSWKTLPTDTTDWGHFPADATDMQREGGMWFYALFQLRQTKSAVLAAMLHCYMLLMNQHLRLLVQQHEQYGFDQFQYITLIGAREAAEDPNKTGFAPRFRQFHGMYGPDLAHIEARFSPKETPQDTVRFLRTLWQGYREATQGKNTTAVTPCPACPRIAEQFCIHNGTIRHRPSPLTPKEKTPPSLALVAHFIKEADTADEICRHMKLRDKIYKRARALVAARQILQHTDPSLHAAIVGKDAASNELEAPPEVFAPTFRYLNSEGITHTTYHAGEDFEHLLSGIRAVHEAITFLRMGSGDRIGHATALGLDPGYCAQKTVHCHTGAWLDSLVWLTWFIEKTPDLATAYGGEIARLRPTISSLYTKIYEKDCPDLPVLWKAWELRAYDVRLLAHDRMLFSSSHTLREYGALDKEENKEKDERENLYQKARRELELYHHKECRKRWKKMMDIPPEKQPTPPLLQVVQDAIIIEMRQKNILVEVLPTSNVRISHYNTTDDHHVMRWLDPDNLRPAPRVVLGTDDPGIFSTNLRNEYTLVLLKLQSLHPGRDEKPYEIVRHLIENGKSYRFR